MSNDKIYKIMDSTKSIEFVPHALFGGVSIRATASYVQVRENVRTSLAE